jgi:peptidoglycan-associated lipoprotein
MYGLVFCFSRRMDEIMNRKILLGSMACVAVLLTACKGVCPIDTAADVAAGGAADFSANVQDKVYFYFNDATLTSDAEKIVAKQADYLKTRTALSVTVEGHADARGTEEYNKALASKRANAVMAALVKSGVSADRITVVSYGKERLLSSGTTEKDHAMNRRSVTIVAG